VLYIGSKLVHPLRVPESRKGSGQQRVLTTRAILITAIALLLLTVALVLLLDTQVRTAPVDATKNRLEALKLALSIGAGTGGFIALLLAARKQQVSERELEQREKIHQETKDFQERVASSTELDSAIRRSSESYTKSVEQLGSDRAAVRLGGLYALARLGDENPQLRQTVINVWCAYLRMPFGVDGQGEIDANEVMPAQSEADAPWVPAARAVLAQELVVRATAQRLIEERLLDSVHPAVALDATPTHWSGMDVDLSNAVVLHFDLSRCKVRHARFIATRFAHGANFSSAEFESATFGGSSFTGDGCFDEAVIRTFADFTRVTFAGDARFIASSFGRSQFHRTEFTQSVHFDRSIFMEQSSWEDCEFKSVAYFSAMTFNGSADFDTAFFHEHASFDGCQFADKAIFWNAGASEGISLADVSFYGDVSLPEGDLDLYGAHLRDGNECSNLPEDWGLSVANLNWRSFYRVEDLAGTPSEDASSYDTSLDK
jgi:uncharacterized protein YjbI with pentapeptide repeats